MLVLTRRIEEEVILQVGDIEIVASLEDLHGNQAKLGFDAPPEVKILRAALLENADE
ncbi:carbon storage regulator [endosymbiont of Lamellibrachia barhami]|uniref:carbon storage regulator n=1 Tax=endosymbiont of Lamellibrachia barhami TaxID=205975 RepID=UPI0015AFA146|nr:carbon storage regulator [endosymbiont of Lamellibrachia barhami]